MRPGGIEKRFLALQADLVVDAFGIQIGLGLPVQGKVEIARKNLPPGTVVEFEDVALPNGRGFSSRGRFGLCLKRFEVGQPRDDEPLVIGLALRDQPEDMLSERLPGLSEFCAVAILQLLEDLHSPFDGGRSQDLFMRIGHVQ
jgi:hypothetical protein